MWESRISQEIVKYGFHLVCVCGWEGGGEKGIGKRKVKFLLRYCERKSSVGDTLNPLPCHKHVSSTIDYTYYAFHFSSQAEKP